MKLKDVFLGLCIAALLVSEFFLFLANQQKNDALGKAGAAQHDADQARADLAQYKNAADAQAAENIKLRAENQSLQRKVADLANKNTQLAGAGQQLSQQLSAYQQAAEQQQQQLQQIQYENQQAQAAAALNACMNALRQIEAAKAEWALENNKRAGAVPVAQDLLPYLTGGVFPACPSGGTYTIGAIGTPPSCSFHGALPAQ